METIIQQAVNGVALASVYALLAIGITLIFGLTRIVNFAHGEFLVLGGLVTYSLVSADVPYVAAAVLAVAAMGAAGWAAERFLFRPTLAEPIRGFIVSLGLIIVLQSFAVKVWGSEERGIPAPIEHVFAFGDIRLSAMRIVVFAAALAAFGLFAWLLARSRWGRALRTLSLDPEIASTMGIPVSRYISSVFVLGTAMAGLAGALLLALFPMSPFSGGSYVIKGFAVAIIGGLGNVKGAVVAALVLGEVEAIAAGYLSPSWATAYAFAGMILILLIRPSGILRGAT